jgi:DNA polymerase-3 subunit beta
MEFVIAREEFQRALDRVQGIVDKRNTIPQLAGVLIQTRSEGIQLTAFDTEIGFIGEYPASVVSEGSINLNARQLFDIVKNLPQDSVRLKLSDNNRVEITSGKAYFKVVGEGAETYPAIPNLEGAAALEISGTALKRMIEHTFFSIATDDSRYGLNGAFLEPLQDDQGYNLRMISTDGHRLSLINENIAGGVRLGDGVLLSRKGLAELKKLCDEFGNEAVQMSMGGNSAIFRSGHIVFFMRLLEGDFPDYRQVIPQRHHRRAVMSREELQKGLRRVAILSSEKTHSVRFRLTADGLEISASNPDLGESREMVDAEVQGDPLAVGFNARYFQDALSVIGGEKVALELGDSLHPGILKGDGRTDVMFVVMPMRLE